MLGALNFTMDGAFMRSHAVPKGYKYLTFFVVALIIGKILPKDKDMKIFEIDNRYFIALVLSFFCTLFEIWLSTFNAHIWNY